MIRSQIYIENPVSDVCAGIFLFRLCLFSTYLLFSFFDDRDFSNQLNLLRVRIVVEIETVIADHKQVTVDGDDVESLNRWEPGDQVVFDLLFVGDIEYFQTGFPVTDKQHLFIDAQAVRLGHTDHVYGGNYPVIVRQFEDIQPVDALIPALHSGVERDIGVSAFDHHRVAGRDVPVTRLMLQHNGILERINQHARAESHILLVTIQKVRRDVRLRTCTSRAQRRADRLPHKSRSLCLHRQTALARGGNEEK